MRQALIDSLKALELGTFKVSSELPWDAAGTALYLKNPKVFYVDEPDRTQESILNTLCSMAPAVANRTTTVSVYVLCDAKQKPSNYDSLMEQVEGLISQFTGVRSREVDRITTFEADQLLTEFEFRITETIIN